MITGVERVSLDYETQCEHSSFAQ